MSAQAMSAAMRTRGLTLTQRAVLCYLCDRMDQRHGCCWPSFEEISWELNICRRSVVYALKALEELEFISVTRRSKQVSNYRVQHIPDPPRFRHIKGACDAPIEQRAKGAENEPLAVEGACDAPSTSATDAPLEQPRVHFIPTKGANNDMSEVHDVHPLSPNISPIESPKQNVVEFRPRNRVMDGEPEGFAEFYMAYPKRVGRRRASKAFAAALKRGATIEAIMEALRRQKFSEDPHWRPHPATWLNDDRWLDEQEEDLSAHERIMRDGNFHSILFNDAPDLECLEVAIQ